MKIMISLLGRISQDIELKQYNGGEYIQFAVATNNDDNKTTIFMNCVAFDAKTKYIRNFCHKGDLVFISGALNQTKRNDKTYYEVVVSSVEKILSAKPKEEEPKTEPTVEPTVEPTSNLPFDGDSSLPF